jgi:radical SAM enzyme (TIGR01210 family)
MQREVLKELVEIFNKKPIYIGVGLESSNSYILRSYVNKPFTYNNQFKKCVKTAESVGAFVKHYVLLKPPFLTEKEAIDDAISTIKDAFDADCDIVSLNPVAVHADTLVDKLWKKGDYSPPWLWSVLNVLEQSQGFLKGKRRLICEIMAGGLPRGPHNCGKCDTKVLKEIEYFSKRGKFSPSFSNLYCECKDYWQFICESEGYLTRTGSISNHFRQDIKFNIPI